jgi:hypothetical protein
MKHAWHQTADMDKIYFSTIAHSDEWTIWGTASYYFPFASRLAQIKYGWNILGAYVAIRLWLEELRGKL